MNYGYTPEELTSGKPIIGIAQTGSDISPCNRVHIKLAERIREGIRTAGGIAFEFPVHPIQTLIIWGVFLLLQKTYNSFLFKNYFIDPNDIFVYISLLKIFLFDVVLNKDITSLVIIILLYK